MSAPTIVMYTSHACAYCMRARRLLAKKGVEVDERHLSLGDAQARQDLAALTGRFTVPQIIVDDRPLGGWDEIKALDDAGELDAILGLA